MIIEGNSRRNGKWFTTHIQRTDQGQQVSIAEVRGLAGDSIRGWFVQMEAMALETRGENYFYHANIDPRADEHMTEEQWEHAVDTLEHNLGLDGQPRFVVEHEKDGRTHRHVFWARADLNGDTLIRDSHNYDIHQRTADQLEEEFGHERTPRGREPGKSKGPKNYEYFRGKAANLSVEQVEAELKAMWHQADSPQAFAAAIAEEGYILCEGDRGLCVVDPAAKEHSLYRRLDLRKKELDPRMEAIDREALPTVEEARAMARERADEGDEQEKPVPAHKKQSPAFELAAQEIAEAIVEAIRGKERGPADGPTPEPPPDGDRSKADARAHKDEAATAAPASAPAQPELPDGAEREQNTAAGQEPPRGDEPRTETTDPGARGSEVPYAARVPEPDPETAHRNSPARSPKPPERLIPIARRQPSVFARMRDALAKGAEWLRAEPTVAESADAPTRSRAPSAPEVTRAAVGPARFEPAAADSALTRFESLAGELAQETQAHGPPVAEFTAAALVALPALSEFERHAQERLTARCEAEDDPNRLAAAGIDWRARQSGIAYLPEHPPEGELSGFARLTWDKFSATRDNGGEPVTRDGSTGFWQRVRALLTEAIEHVAEWARDRLDGFAERLRRDRDAENERER